MTCISVIVCEWLWSLMRWRSCLMKSLKRPSMIFFLFISQGYWYSVHCSLISFVSVDVVVSRHGFCIIEKTSVTNISSFYLINRSFSCRTLFILQMDGDENKQDRHSIFGREDKARCNGPVLIGITSMVSSLHFSKVSLMRKVIERSNRWSARLCYPQVKRPIMSREEEKHHQEMFI